MAKKKTGRKPGTFLRIALPDGTFGYARMLEWANVAFYRYQTAAPQTDLEVIAAHPVAFTVAVNATAVSAWDKIGWREIEPALEEPVSFFLQNAVNPRKCTIFDTAGNERTATPAECVGLESAAVWEDAAVKQRLLDTFAGRPNATFERLKPQLI